MAIELILRKTYASNHLKEEYVCDTDADIENLPKSYPGSTAMVVESGKIYMVNASGEWKPFGKA